MKVFLAGCAAALLTASTAFVQATVAGTWALQMNWPGGASTGSCVFEQDGDTLRGSCGGGDDRFPITGRVAGRKLSWRVDVKQGGAQGRMAFDGEFDEQGTTITGSCNVGDQFGSFTMRRL